LKPVKRCVAREEEWVMRYFFHIDDDIPNNDLDGVDFPNLDAVRKELTVLCGEMLADAGLRFWSNPDWRVRVTDEEGRLVVSMSIRGDMIESS
jgi:hypothetical protein